MEKAKSLAQKGRTSQRPVMHLKPRKQGTIDSQSAQAAPAKVRPGGSKLTPEERHRMVAEAAYYRAEKEGFAIDPVQAWLTAEAEVDALLNGDATKD